MCRRTRRLRFFFLKKLSTKTCFYHLCITAMGTHWLNTTNLDCWYTHKKSLEFYFMNDFFLAWLHLIFSDGINMFLLVSYYTITINNRFLKFISVFLTSLYVRSRIYISSKPTQLKRTLETFWTVIRISKRKIQ